MRERDQPHHVAPHDKGALRPYAKPQLSHLGSIRDLARGASGSFTETSSTKKNTLG